jgi:hypothetical protein
LASAEAARDARADLIAQLQRGEARTGGNLRLTEAREKLVLAAREGKALNKRGQRYKPRHRRHRGGDTRPRRAGPRNAADHGHPPR